MEKLIKSRDYIAAIIRLYQFSQNIRYNVSANKFMNDDIGNIAIDINKGIKKNYGIDIFAKQTPENLHQYEDKLSKIVLNYTTRIIAGRDVDDETELIRNIILFDKDLFKEKKISIAESYKPYIQYYPFNSEKIINVCKKPFKIVLFKGFSKNSRKNYLLISQITITNQSYYVLIHLTNTSGEENRLEIVSVFVISQEMANKYSENPERLFLACLDKFGLNIIINGKTKRVYGKEKVFLEKPFNGEKLDFIKIKQVNKSDKFYFSLNLKRINAKYIDLEFVYGVNLTKYFKYLDNLLK